MAANIFVKISDIPGDATEDKHKGWIVIDSLDWEIARAVDMTDLGSTQRGHANANFGKVVLSSEFGKASHKLMLSVANGTIRPMIEIHQCRSGPDAAAGLEEFLIWKLHDVQIDKYTKSASSDGIPKENWELAYRKIEIEYKETDPKTAKLKKAGDFKWNLESGKVD